MGAGGATLARAATCGSPPSGPMRSAPFRATLPHFFAHRAAPGARRARSAPLRPGPRRWRRPAPRAGTTARGTWACGPPGRPRAAPGGVPAARVGSSGAVRSRSGRPARSRSGRRRSGSRLPVVRCGPGPGPVVRRGRPRRPSGGDCRKGYGATPVGRSSPRGHPCVAGPSGSSGGRARRSGPRTRPAVPRTSSVTRRTARGSRSTAVRLPRSRGTSGAGGPAGSCGAVRAAGAPGPRGARCPAGWLRARPGGRAWGPGGSPGGIVGVVRHLASVGVAVPGTRTRVRGEAGHARRVRSRDPGPGHAVSVTSWWAGSNATGRWQRWRHARSGGGAWTMKLGSRPVCPEWSP